MLQSRHMQNPLSKHQEFKPLIKKHGAPPLKRGTNIFKALCRSIIHQQVSGKAAESILKKFVALFPGKSFPKPEDILALPIDTLRSAGLSGQKAAYITDLAQKYSDGTLEHKRIPKMTSDEIVEHLTQVKGIGVWTVHMLLIFTLNRPDVLPVGDLGIKKGFQILYRLRKLPTPSTMERLAKPWRAHASHASWYLWRAADDAPSAQKYRPKK